MTPRNTDLLEDGACCSASELIRRRYREGRDVFGDGVNVAARLQAWRCPAAVCISRAVRDQLRDKSPFVFEDWGEQAVKNIARPVRMFDGPLRGGAEPVGPANRSEAFGGEIAARRNDDGASGRRGRRRSNWRSGTPSGQRGPGRFPRRSRGSRPATSRPGAAPDRRPDGGRPSGSDEEVKFEIAYWESVKDSDHPRCSEPIPSDIRTATSRNLPKRGWSS